MTKKNIINSIMPIIEGMEVAARTVESTFGPNGGLVLYENRDKTVDSNPFYLTRDGATVLDQLELNSPCNIGIKIIKQMVKDLKEDVGDGSTTLTLLTYNLLREVNKYIVAGYDPILISKELKRLSYEICNNLERMSYPLKTYSDLFIMAMGACKSKELAEIVCIAIEYKGQNGIILIEETKSTYIEMEKLEGYTLDRGYIHEMFITDKYQSECYLEHPYVFITNYTLSSQAAIPQIISKVEKKDHLLIISPEIERVALFECAKKIEQGYKICAIKNPSFAQKNATHRLLNESEDIAIYTGATSIMRETGRTLGKITLADFGQADKIVIRKNNTLIINGYGDPQAIQQRMKSLQYQSKFDKNDFDREMADKRFLRLNNNIIFIKVGGYTDHEVIQKKRLINDAIASCQAALKNGIVPGAGLSYIYASKNIDGFLKTPINRIMQYLFHTIIKKMDNGSSDTLWSTIRKDASDRYSHMYTSYDILTSIIEGKATNFTVIDPTLVCKRIVEMAFGCVEEIIKSQYIILEGA